MVTVEFPVLVVMTLCEAEVPTVTLPKFIDAGLAESFNTCAMPVPLRAMLVGEVGALLTRLRLPGKLPADAGAKAMFSAAELPGAMESGSERPDRL